MTGRSKHHPHRHAGIQTNTYIAGVINGNGSGLTSLDASQLTSGAVPSAVLTSVPAANLTGTISQAQLPAAVVTNMEMGVILGGSFSGNGGGLTNLNASQLASGVVSTSVLPGFQGNADVVGGGRK